MLKNLSGLVKVIQPVKNEPKIDSESLKSLAVFPKYVFLAHICD